MAVNFALLLQSVPAEHKVSYSNHQSLLNSYTKCMMNPAHMLMITVRMWSTQDAIFQHYHDVLAQCIFYALAVGFPESLDLLTPALKQNLAQCTARWTLGNEAAFTCLHLTHAYTYIHTSSMRHQLTLLCYMPSMYRPHRLCTRVERLSALEELHGHRSHVRYVPQQQSIRARADSVEHVSPVT